MIASHFFSICSLGLTCGLLFSPLHADLHGHLISPVLASRATEVENALERGFGFLVEIQREDGSFEHFTAVEAIEYKVADQLIPSKR